MLDFPSTIMTAVIADVAGMSRHEIRSVVCRNKATSARANIELVNRSDRRLTQTHWCCVNYYSTVQSALQLTLRRRRIDL